MTFEYDNDFNAEAIWQDQDAKLKIDAVQADLLINRLVKLGLDIEHDNYARKKPIIKELKTHDASNLQKRLFDHICQFLGYDLASVKGNKIKSLGMAHLRTKAFSQQNEFLVTGFIADKRDVVFWGGGGTRKTLITLQMVMAMLKGETFGDQTTNSQHKDKKILFIGCDGGVSADSVHADYFDFWVADEDQGIPSWNLSTSNLVKLKNAMASDEYTLVVIDSLKAACSYTD